MGVSVATGIKANYTNSPIRASAQNGLVCCNSCEFCAIWVGNSYIGEVWRGIGPDGRTVPLPGILPTAGM
jgi:hypothetical protein